VLISLERVKKDKLNIIWYLFLCNWYRKCVKKVKCVKRLVKLEISSVVIETSRQSGERSN
jgi:hypothetical protein